MESSPRRTAASEPDHPVAPSYQRRIADLTSTDVLDETTRSDGVAFTHTIYGIRVCELRGIRQTAYLLLHEDLGHGGFGTWEA